MTTKKAIKRPSKRIASGLLSCAALAEADLDADQSHERVECRMFNRREAKAMYDAIAWLRAVGHGRDPDRGEK